MKNILGIKLEVSQLLIYLTDFDPCFGTDMFKLSNPSPILNAMLMASLDVSYHNLDPYEKQIYFLYSPQ